MGSLKAFIKSVRSAKTLKDERNVIQKESAKIRSAFRSSGTSAKSRRENISKLLYLFTLGERTHFGQVECVKLLASPHFTDKRLGYLGSMLLLDEDQEVLMLVTNSIDNDLSHPNQYVISMALTTLANIASTTMARDLFQRIETLITNSNPYIKKKAALCALRIIRRVPDYEEVFVKHVKDLLTDDNHGVLLCAASLATDMIDNNPQLVEEFAPLLPKILAKLKQLSSNGFSSEYDIAGVPDPYLQCRLLRLLRAMGQDNEELSEQMSDLLAAIATNTDNSKNVGNSVLYECVLTIFGIETGPPQSDSGLRVLGISILAKFLTKKNINTRYAALNTLLRVVETEPNAVQRHRQTILDCINDADISIRRRALELSYVLINAENIRLMVKELLIVLGNCDAEFKSQLVFQIALNAERFAPNVKWHINTLLSMFRQAGNYTKVNVMSAFILLVINAPELQLYATQKCFAALKKDLSQEGLTVVTLWLLGEHGDILIKAGNFSTDDEPDSQVDVSGRICVELILKVLQSPHASQTVQEYAINALIKLSTRCKDAKDIEDIRLLLSEQEKSLSIEIQQRAVEYSALLCEAGSLRKGILGKMPAPKFGDDLEAQHAKALSKALIKRRRRGPAAVTSAKSKPDPTESYDILDLDNVGSDSGTSSQTTVAASEVLSDIFGTRGVSAQNEPSLKQDILSLFGPQDLGDAATTPTPSNTTLQASTKQSKSASPLDDLSSISVPAASIQSYPADVVQAWSNDDVTLSFSAENEQPGKARLVAYFQANQAISDINMQVALPKSQQLSLQSIDQSWLNAGERSHQKMKVSGPVGGNIRLRIRLSYKKSGQLQQQQFDFTQLPKNLL